jgi:hypothetical protein
MRIPRTLSRSWVPKRLARRLLSSSRWVDLVATRLMGVRLICLSRRFRPSAPLAPTRVRAEPLPTSPPVASPSPTSTTTPSPSSRTFSARSAIPAVTSLSPNPSLRAPLSSRRVPTGPVSRPRRRGLTWMRTSPRRRRASGRSGRTTKAVMRGSLSGRSGQRRRISTRRSRCWSRLSRRPKRRRMVRRAAQFAVGAC